MPSKGPARNCRDSSFAQKLRPILVRVDLADGEDESIVQDALLVVQEVEGRGPVLTGVQGVESLDRTDRFAGRDVVGHADLVSCLTRIPTRP